MEILPTIVLINLLVLHKYYDVVGAIITMVLGEVTYAANLASVFWLLEHDEESD